MKTNTVIGSAIATALLGAGILAGSVVGSGSVAAQTPTTTAQATATPSTSTTDPSAGLPPVGPGMGRAGHHSRGGEGFGGGATAENATQQISNTTSLINLVKADLAYANGKMDTTDAQRWVSGAVALLTKAQGANTSSQYGQSVSYAHAARELAMTAQMQMAQELGADTLPSYSQLPQRGSKGIDAGTDVTQARASFILASTYERLVMQGTLVESAANASEAAPYITDAQGAYTEAYNAYQAGNYAEAVQSAKLAERLAHVAGNIVRAPAAPNNSDTPVTVPAPNFP